MESTSEEVPLSQISLCAIPFNGHQLPFNDQQLLDFYEHALARAFQQVEELKRIRRSRKVGTWKGSCMCFGSSASSRLTSMSVRKSSDVFKKSGGSHGRRPSRMTSVQIGAPKEEPLTSDGLMLAVDKFLTAEFRR